MAKHKTRSARKSAGKARRRGGEGHLHLVSGHVGTVGAGEAGAGPARPGGRRASWRVIEDDCVAAMRGIEANSVDSIVCDPPYALAFLGADWDTYSAKEFQDFCQRWGAEALRVLKPGGYLLAFSAARTYHRLTCGLEDAGFVIVDQLQWLNAQGMPKATKLGHQLGHASKTALATALKGAHEPIVVAQKPREGTYLHNLRAHGVGALHIDACRVGDIRTGAETPGRWPANVLLGHTDHCVRLGGERVATGAHWSKSRVSGYGAGIGTGRVSYEGPGERPGTETVERWDCAPDRPVAALDAQAQTGTTAGVSRYFLTVAAEPAPGAPAGANVDAEALPLAEVLAGRAPRFMYCPKLKSAGERDAGLDTLPPSAAKSARRNTHTTVKPIALMRWLLRLVTPPGGVTLDPFCGSGSTGCAVMVENADPVHAPGWSFIGIEREAEYATVARARIAHWERAAGEGEARQRKAA